MRNIQHTALSSLKGLSLAGKWLHAQIDDGKGNKIENPKYVAYYNCEEKLKVAYQEYDNHTNPCSLEELSPLFEDEVSDTSLQTKQKKTYREGLYNLYNSERGYMRQFREEVAAPNGRYLICPYCGCKPVEDLDHYIPRAVMPEYSVHLWNLIPLCHKCNKEKHDEWLDVNGRRQFFNSYFDPLPDIKDYLNVSFQISLSPQLPQITIEFDHAAAQADNESGRLVSSTVSKLHLVELYWQPKAEEILKDETRQILVHVRIDMERNPGLSIDDAWTHEKDSISLIVSQLEPHEFIKYVVYKAICASPEMESWMQRYY